MKNFTQALEELKNGNRVRRSGARWFVQMVDTAYLVTQVVS